MTRNQFNMTDFRSDKAIVAKNQRVTDAGSIDTIYVILADGYMLDCGHGPVSVTRAAALATIINEAPEHLRESLDKWNIARMKP